MNKFQTFLTCSIVGAFVFGFTLNLAHAAECPTKKNPFLVQITAEGIGTDLSTAKLAAKNSLKERAILLKETYGFPTMFKMFIGLTHELQTFPELPREPTTTATLIAWYELDFDKGIMTPFPSRCFGKTTSGVIQEHDVVHDEGY